MSIYDNIIYAHKPAGDKGEAGEWDDASKARALGVVADLSDIIRKYYAEGNKVRKDTIAAQIAVINAAQKREAAVQQLIGSLERANISNLDSVRDAVTAQRAAIMAADVKLSTSRDAMNTRVFGAASAAAHTGGPAAGWRKLFQTITEVGLAPSVSNIAMPNLLQEALREFEGRDINWLLDGKAWDAHADEIVQSIAPNLSMTAADFKRYLDTAHQTLRAQVDSQELVNWNERLGIIGAKQDEASLQTFLTEARTRLAGASVAGPDLEAAKAAGQEFIKETGEIDRLRTMIDSIQQQVAGGDMDRRDKVAKIIMRPNFRYWAEANGYRLGTADIDPETGDVRSYSFGPDDTKAIVKYWREKKHPDSIFRRSRDTGVYVERQLPSVKAESMRGTDGRFATVGGKLLDPEEAKQEEARALTPRVKLGKLGDVSYVEVDGKYYTVDNKTAELVPMTGAPPIKVWRPVVVRSGGKPDRWATLDDLHAGVHGLDVLRAGEEAPPPPPTIEYSDQPPPGDTVTVLSQVMKPRAGDLAGSLRVSGVRSDGSHGEELLQPGTAAHTALTQQRDATLREAAEARREREYERHAIKPSVPAAPAAPVAPVGAPVVPAAPVAPVVPAAAAGPAAGAALAEPAQTPAPRVETGSAAKEAMDTARQRREVLQSLAQPSSGGVNGGATVGDDVVPTASDAANSVQTAWGGAMQAHELDLYRRGYKKAAREEAERE